MAGVPAPLRSCMTSDSLGIPTEFGQVRRDWMISPRLNTEQRRALELLASSRFGISEERLVHGHVFSRHVLAELVRAGFAVAERRVMAGDRAIEVRVRITTTGRGAIKR
jgi:hypothetical protein